MCYLRARLSFLALAMVTAVLLGSVLARGDVAAYEEVKVEKGAR